MKNNKILQFAFHIIEIFFWICVGSAGAHQDVEFWWMAFIIAVIMRVINFRD